MDCSPNFKISGLYARTGEIYEFMAALDGSLHETLIGPCLGPDEITEEIDHEGVYAEYSKVQDEFIANANRWLEKMKLPQIDKTPGGNLYARVEQACSVTERISRNSRDKNSTSRVGKAKRAFQSLCKNAKAGKFVAALIPDDMFGSVLSNSLEIIFTALEEVDAFHEAALKAVERIPRILEDNAEYIEWASNDKEVHRRTAKLYTKICLALNHILKWYSTRALVAAAKKLLNAHAFSSDLGDLMAEVKLAAKDVKTRATQSILSQLAEGQGHVLFEGVKANRQILGIQDSLAYLARSLQFSNFGRVCEKAVQESLPLILEQSVQRLMIQNVENRELGPVLDVQTILEQLCYDGELIANDLQALLRKCRSKTRIRVEADRVGGIKDNARVGVSWVSRSH